MCRRSVGGVQQGSCSLRQTQAANGPGQSSGVRKLGFWRAVASPSSLAIPRNLLGKCGHEEPWPGRAGGGVHRSCCTRGGHSIGFRLVGWLIFKREENEKNKLWHCDSTRLTKPTPWQQWPPPQLWIRVSFRGSSYS